MMIRITMVIDCGEDFGDMNDKEEREWFESIMTRENTYVHNNDIGDELGEVRSMSWRFLPEPELNECKGGEV